MLSGTFYYVRKNITTKERNGCDTDVQHNNLLGHIKTSVVRYKNKIFKLGKIRPVS